MERNRFQIRSGECSSKRPRGSASPLRATAVGEGFPRISAREGWAPAVAGGAGAGTEDSAAKMNNGAEAVARELHPCSQQGANAISIARVRGERVLQQGREAGAIPAIARIVTAAAKVRNAPLIDKNDTS